MLPLRVMRPPNATMSIAPRMAAPRRPLSLPPRYTLDALLAQGGQGAVYEGVDALTGDTVAVKLSFFMDATATARMNREVAALRLLDIPGVVRLLDSGADEDGAWIVMERVPGRPFPAGRSTWEALEPVVLALLETLARVHDAGLLHRDIKPGNVLVDDVGRPVLLDFGLARGALAGPTITRAGAVMGTPRYMSPEQIRGERADRRSDLYALGAMIWEALVGEVPLESDHVALMFEARLRSDAPTVLTALPSLPLDVVRLVDSLVARRPEARPISARAAMALLHGGARAPVLPRIGGDEPVTALLAAAREGASANVAGPRGTGRTRVLQEVAAALALEGVEVRWVGAADAPLGSLRRLLGELEADDPDPLATMGGRLAAVAAGGVFLVDDWETVDAWSRSLLVRASATVLSSSLPPGLPAVRRSLPPMIASEPPLRVVAMLRAFTQAEIAEIIAGPERLLHLPSDGAALLVRRTGGIAARVANEVARWTAAGLASLVDGRLRVGRTALDRISGGFAGPAVSDGIDDELPVDLDELLAWVHLGGPGCTIPRLAAARGEPAWRLDLAVRQLESLGAVARTNGIIEPTRPATALLTWQSDVRMAVHGTFASTLPPGTPGRMYHLVALGDARGAVDDACALADHLAAEARLSEAMAALQEAGRLALSTGVWADSLWCRLATLAIQDGTRPALAAAAELLARSECDPVLGVLVTAALRLVSGERRSAMEALATLTDQPDAGLERLRWEVRLQAARAEGGMAYASLIEGASRWALATGTDEARASRADWVSGWLFQAGDIRQAAKEAEAGALIPQPLDRRMRLMLRAMTCLLLLAEVQRVESLAAELRTLAHERRLPKMEAYGEWVSRLVANQLRTARGLDEDLIAAVGEIGAPEISGQIWVTEAVIAWWSGSHPRGAELARRAELAFLEAGARVTAVWARAVRVACAPDPLAAARIAAEAVATERQDIVLEVLGLLKLTGGLTGEWSEHVARALAEIRPVGYNSSRRGALSADEVRAAFA